MGLFRDTRRRGTVGKTEPRFEAERVLQITPRANFCFEFPDLPEAHTLDSHSQLCDVIDID
jgi:hypothetical protein